MVKKNNSKIARISTQLLFFILALLISINHQLSEVGQSIPIISSASLHALCPFGGVVSIYTLVTEGNFVQKIHESSFVVLSIVIFLSVLFGPVFCGWMCPLGTIQEAVGRLGRKIFKNKYNGFIPYKYDKYLRCLRYFVFARIVYETAYTGKLIFLEADPYHALFNFWTSEATVVGIIILAVTLILSLFVERPWCKYACPLGAVLGVSNFIRIFKIRRDQSTCINCKSCDRSCPMNIVISDKRAVMSHQCISCFKCTSEVACPVDNTVEMKTRGRD